MSARPMHLLALAAALLLVLAGPRSLAQEPPPVRIDAVVEAEGTPYVGQRVTVVVTLYTLTNFDTAPAFDLPPVDGAVLLPPEDRPVLGTTSVDDETYTTGRHELAFFAQRAGTLELPSFKVRFASPPAWGEAPVEHGLMTPALEIEAVMPPGAEGLASVICATELSAEQSLTPEAESVKVGDALTRTVTLRAEGVPGMALPPTLVGEVEGASSYPAEPTVTDDRARGAFAGARTDQVT